MNDEGTEKIKTIGIATFFQNFTEESLPFFLEYPQPPDNYHYVVFRMSLCYFSVSLKTNLTK